ncbi:hypothetical protein NDU88_003262 [Pleurodeles waltl]|uniref:Uncharacterized protein n=1 Tax=Pleurodeles waltl TaxID=8319 RepID=A0AAV7M2X7_PLEWA|nr:hypothetical protein NDU88_003262 [Pleurodeles waltl]
MPRVQPLTMWVGEGAVRPARDQEDPDLWLANSRALNSLSCAREEATEVFMMLLPPPVTQLMFGERGTLHYSPGGNGAWPHEDGGFAQIQDRFILESNKKIRSSSISADIDTAGTMKDRCASHGVGFKAEAEPKVDSSSTNSAKGGSLLGYADPYSKLEGTDKVPNILGA